MMMYEDYIALDDWPIEKDLEGSTPGLIKVLSWHFLGGDWEKTTVKITSIWVKIWTKHL